MNAKLRHLDTGRWHIAAMRLDEAQGVALLDRAEGCDEEQQPRGLHFETSHKSYSVVRATCERIHMVERVLFAS